MKKSIAFCVLSILITNVFGQVIFDTPLSDRVTGYSLDVDLDTEKKTISGNMKAFWVNISQDEVRDVQLHMYLNAFRSNKSTFYKESFGSPGSDEIDFGWIEINEISDRYGMDLSEGMRFIQPDDGNENDMTVLQVDLIQAAMPGDTVFLKINFTSKLPSSIRRTGFTDDYFFIAQWFPKFGVYEPAGMRYAEEGGWNCHQFHSNSEFYANHSVYDVKITLPKEYVIGTGGLLLGEEDTGEDLKTLTYRAEDLVDFAWTTWPEYLVAEDEWEHVKIRFLYPPGREDQVDRQLEAVKNGLEYLTDHVGPFPWPHLTFVDPPAKGAGAGGMEYTTIFTSASSARLPEFILMPEMVTVHEFGHAYFMGILANNEFEEPWMDEGINSYWEARIMDHYWGPDRGIVNHEKFWIADRSFSRVSYTASSGKQVIDNTAYSWDYPHFTYGMMSYNKAATWLFTLQGIVGENTMDEIFKTFYKEWGFDHPDAHDFIEVTNRVVNELHGDKFGPDMNWFFDQTLFGTGIVDYKLASISNYKLRSFKGIVKSDTGMVYQKDDTEGDSIYFSVVRLERLGEVMLPVELLVHFDNGEEISEYWDGKSTYKDFEYTSPDRVLWAKIDPEGEISMDVNFLNNSYTTVVDRIPVKKVSRKLASMIQFLIHLLTL